MSNGHIISAGKRLEVGEVGLSLELNAGQHEDIASGREYHLLCLWADPVDDGMPRIVMTDAELFADALPGSLDAMTIDVELSTGDFVDVSGRPWIRPGSLTGMTEVIFEPASIEESGGDWDPNARKFVEGHLKLTFAAEGDLYRVTIAVNHEDPPARVADKPDFYAEFLAPLELTSED